MSGRYRNNLRGLGAQIKDSGNVAAAGCQPHPNVLHRIDTCRHRLGIEDALNTRSLVFILSCVVFLLWAKIFWDYSIDDAFITFRYAENLANGHGLVFNPGGEAVEGYSNFLWLLVLALLYKVGFSTYLTAKCLGLLTAGATGTALFWYFRDDKHSLRWLAGPLFLVCLPLVFWALSGLELGLHALIVTLTVLAAWRQSRWTYALIPLLVLSRPEGAPIAVVLLASMFVSDILNKRAKISFYLIALGVTVVAFGGLTLFRIEVFGYPFPNTYYAKMQQKLYGFDLLLEFLLRFLPLTLAALWGLVILARTRFSDRVLTTCLGLFVAQAVISASVDPVMNWLYRYLIPVLPFLFIAGLTAVETFKRSRMIGYGLAVLIVASSVSVYPKAMARTRWNRTIVGIQDKVIAWAKTIPYGATISMTDMGRIPYYTGRNFHDLWGLVDKDIAHEGYNPLKEFLQLPDYFILVGYTHAGNLKLKFWREQLLTVGSHFDRCYEAVQGFGPSQQDPDTPEYDYLVWKRRPEAQSVVDSYDPRYWKGLFPTPSRNSSDGHQ